MFTINLQRIQFRYPKQTTDLLTDVSFTINAQSRIGLIGCNGCGKSTLFALLLDKKLLQSGQIIQTANVQFAYLPQEIKAAKETSLEEYLWQSVAELWRTKRKIERLGDDVSLEDANIFDDFYQAGGYEFAARVNELLPQFNFSESDLTRKFAQLSGGEQTKLGLCALQLTNPDVLLLDEPSNHLDTETLQWLQQYLKQLNIAYVLISHDRVLLTDCVDQIVEIEQGKSRHYRGNYDFYKQQKEQLYQNELTAQQQHKKKIRQLKDAATQREQWSWVKQKHTRSVTKTGRICKRDDGSLPASKGRMTHSLKAVREKANKLVEHAKSSKPFLQKARKLSINQTQAVQSQWLLRVEGLAKSFAEKQLFSELSFQVKAGERIAITGKNGCGKTTLLNILQGQEQADAGNIVWSPQASIAYYDQLGGDLHAQQNALQNCQTICQDETLIRTTLGQLLFDKTLSEQPINMLSAGERSKVALAKILLQEANVLILDEPTNHLEIAAREALEQSLQSYPGTIIFISHDRIFQSNLKQRTIKISPQNIFCPYIEV